jgi:hypothetical protein
MCAASCSHAVLTPSLVSPVAAGYRHLLHCMNCILRAGDVDARSHALFLFIFGKDDSFQDLASYCPNGSHLPNMAYVPWPTPTSTLPSVLMLTVQSFTTSYPRLSLSIIEGRD